MLETWFLRRYTIARPPLTATPVVARSISGWRNLASGQNRGEALLTEMAARAGATTARAAAATHGAGRAIRALREAGKARQSPPGPSSLAVGAGGFAVGLRYTAQEVEVRVALLADVFVHWHSWLPVSHLAGESGPPAVPLFLLYSPPSRCQEPLARVAGCALKLLVIWSPGLGQASSGWRTGTPVVVVGELGRVFLQPTKEVKA